MQYFGDMYQAMEVYETLYVLTEWNDLSQPVLNGVKFNPQGRLFWIPVYMWSGRGKVKYALVMSGAGFIGGH